MKKKGKYMKKNYIQGVSFPRSGHHLLERILDQYYYNTNKYSYCNFYIHKNSPCYNHAGEIIYQKHHDFNMDLPIDDRKYLIQIRHPIHCWASNLHVQFFGGKNERNLINFTNIMNDKYLDFRYREDPFGLIWHIKWYLQFINKWVFTSLTKSIILNYEDLIENPLDSINKVLYFINNDSLNSLEELNLNFEIKDKNKMKLVLDFISFDELKEIEKPYIPILNKLNISLLKEPI